MTKANEKKVAKAEAKKLLERLGIDDAPVDVDAIAEFLGVQILERAFDDDTSGVIVIKNDQALIGVNSSDSRNRQRFTIAHELGHFLLHRDESNIFVDAILKFRRNENSAEGTDLREIGANTFAAELLMPGSLIDRYIQRFRIDTLDEISVRRLATKFEVSEQALTIRLMSLNYINAY
jgi:Zn-dependent peptidase ImmA (M78 family)